MRSDYYFCFRLNCCRYLNRTAKHATLRTDSDFREFLEADGDLPRSTSTSALSGAGVMRLFNKVGDSFGKMTFKMDETDQVNIFILYLSQDIKCSFALLISRDSLCI